MENDSTKVVKGHEQLSYKDRLTYLAEPNGSPDPLSVLTGSLLS